MMKKRWLTILALALTAVGCCALGACKDAEKGEKGEAGKSAYEIWLDNGYTGTEADFLAWLKGEKGDKGDQGDANAQTQESLRFQKISGKDEYRVMGMGTVSSLDIVIPATYRGLPVTEIGQYAFEDETYIESMEIPDSVTSIGSEAFNNCSSLTSVIIPDSVTTIGNYAFSACTSLTSVVIPDSVTLIGTNAFSGCSSLTSVVIGASVTSIGDRAFSGCISLMEIQYNATECVDFSSSNYIFSYAGQTGEGITVTIGANVKKIPAYMFYPYAYDSSTAPKIVSVIFEEGSVCESIGSYAFGYCSSLTSVVIGDSVTTIGDSAFYNCDSLTSVVIPDSVTSIGSNAFSSCSSLTSVIIPDSVTTIGNSAFEYCSSLTSVIIPDSVTTIGNSAFEYCSRLTSVVIPNNVTSIGSSAFDYCYSLTTVYYKGTASDWSNMSMGWNPKLTAATRYYYDESETAESWWHYDEDGQIVHG